MIHREHFIWFAGLMVTALLILAPSLPFMAVSGAVRGCFLAARRVQPNITAQLVEQLVRMAVAAAGLRLLNEYDGKIKALLTGIFGPENDFDAILGGVNLAGVGANGKRVVQNLLEALTPILREGAERRLKAAADTAEREAAAARTARGAV